MPKNTEPKNTSTPEHLAAGEEKGWLDIPEVEKMPVQERDSLKGLADISKLKGMFGRSSKRGSIEDMNAAIARRGAKKK
jgi:hypothetical protein